MHTFKVYTNVDHMIKLTGVDLVMGCICPRKDVSSTTAGNKLLATSAWGMAHVLPGLGKLAQA